MSEYRLDINGYMELGDYSSISDYISIVSTYDTLIITLDENNIEDFNMVCAILKNTNFKLEVNEDSLGRKHYITAVKIKDS